MHERLAPDMERNPESLTLPKLKKTWLAKTILAGWKKFPDWQTFSLIVPENPCFTLISLTGKNCQIFPWFPWSVGTLNLFSSLLRDGPRSMMSISQSNHQHSKADLLTQVMNVSHEHHLLRLFLATKTKDRYKYQSYSQNMERQNLKPLQLV